MAILTPIRLVSLEVEGEMDALEQGELGAGLAYKLISAWRSLGRFPLNSFSSREKAIKNRLFRLVVARCAEIRALSFEHPVLVGWQDRALSFKKEMNETDEADHEPAVELVHELDEARMWLAGFFLLGGERALDKSGCSRLEEFRQRIDDAERFVAEDPGLFAGAWGYASAFVDSFREDMEDDVRLGSKILFRLASLQRQVEGDGIVGTLKNSPRKEKDN